jgi:hypothetical protein
MSAGHQSDIEEDNDEVGDQVKKEEQAIGEHLVVGLTGHSCSQNGSWNDECNNQKDTGDSRENWKEEYLFILAEYRPAGFYEFDTSGERIEHTFTLFLSY